MNNEEKILSILTKLETGQDELRADIAELKEDVSELKSGVSELTDRVTKLEAGQKKIRKDIKDLKYDVEKAVWSDINLLFKRADNTETRVTRLEEAAGFR